MVQRCVVFYWCVKAMSLIGSESGGSSCELLFLDNISSSQRGALLSCGFVVQQVHRGLGSTVLGAGE